MPQSVPTAAEFNSLAASVQAISDRVTVIKQGLDNLIRMTESSLQTVWTEVNALEDRVKKLETPVVPSTIYDDFKYTEVFVEGQNSKNLKWHTDFVSSGFARTDGNGLIIAPAGPDLRSVQVKSTSQWGDARFTFDVTTEKQTVTSGVQPWMCAWILFRHLDKWRHYYIAVKLNGIEFGKKDAPVGLEPQSEVEKYQKILWTGGPATPLGTKRNIVIETKGDTFKITVDGTTVMTMTDVSSFKSGSLSCYSEGSQARYQNIVVQSI